MSIKSFSELQLDAKRNLNSRLSTLGLTEGFLSTDLRDVIVQQIAHANTELGLVQKESSKDYPTDVDEDKLDDLASNWQLTRKGGVTSIGSITFSRASQPSEDIVIGNIDGTGGVVISSESTPNLSAISFITTQTVKLLATTTADPITGLYSVQAPITCFQSGVVGNVAANKINILQGAISGIDTVTNKTASGGGRDSEGNTELSNRIQLKVQGLHPGISGGFQSLALAMAGVVDAKPVGPSDTEVIRDPNGGSVDLYLLGEKLENKSQSFVYASADSFVLLNTPPVQNILSVSGVVDDEVYSFIKGTDYRFQADSGSKAYSFEASDKLIWLDGTRPDVGTSGVIYYQEDQLVRDVQDEFEADDKFFISADVLVKKSTKVLVDLSLTVYKTSSAVSDTVRSLVATAITDYINNLGLGETLSVSDLVVAITNVSGVDRVVLPLTNLARRSATGTSDLTSTKLEYFRTDDSSLDLTIS